MCIRDSAGAVAVDLFFVISGFLIAASLQRNSVRNYLQARALRILPALVTCVGSVSYTHLDVYKRQAQGRAATCA